MGQSADAYLFWGRHIDTDGTTPEEWDVLERIPKADKTYGSEYAGWLQSQGLDGLVQVDWFGYIDYPNTLVAAKGTMFQALGWGTKKISALPEVTDEQRDAVEKATSMLSDALDAEYRPKWSEPGWWLVPAYG